MTIMSPVSHLQPVWHPSQNLDCTLENIAEYEWQDATCPPPLLFPMILLVEGILIWKCTSKNQLSIDSIYHI